ncbi:MAG TPA: hypothetical protein VNX29_02015 [Kaistia sp.]|nr:hypothetical protein [Kaistia sp.]
MAETFWMIHMTGGGPTGFRHPSAEAAEREAERLARANPGNEFVVLEAKESFCLPLPPIQRRFIGDPVQATPARRRPGPPDIDDDIPF